MRKYRISGVPIVNSMEEKKLVGILIKSGEVLEKIHKMDSIIFDKTGTLTTGKLKVVEITFNGRAGACIIKPEDENIDYTYLVLPVLLQDSQYNESNFINSVSIIISSILNS